MTADPAQRFVLAHGFTQTARSWTRLEALLAEQLPAVTSLAVDLPGHGACDVEPDADLVASAEHLVALGGPAIYVGYSMGGRVALHAALTRPDAVRGLVLIGATAGIDDPVERAERRGADETLAARIEQIGVDAFLDEWLASPLFAGLTAESAQRDERLRNTAHGLATSLRHTGTGTQEPLWPRLDEIRVPALIIAGEHDPKFRALGERVAAGLSDATMAIVPDAGHSVHLEQPDATAGVISQWWRGRFG